MSLFAGPVTFTEFTKYVVHEWSLGKSLNAHWTPQHKICRPCEINYDFIGRFENINNDAKHVLAKIAESGRLTRHINFPLANAFNRRVPLSQRRRLFYDKVPRNILTTLVRIYQLDYELFGYDYRWVYRNNSTNTIQ